MDYSARWMMRKQDAGINDFMEESENRKQLIFQLLCIDDLERPEELFNALKYAEYIEIYKGNYAVLKAMYYY